MLILTPSRIDRLISSSHSLMFIGLGLMILPYLLLPRWVAVGGLTGFALLNLGIYAASLRAWRIEPGLWMLALLLGTILGGCWGFFEFEGLRIAFLPRVANPVRSWNWSQDKFGVDGAFALLIFGETVRFAVSVALWNWKTTRHPRAWNDWLEAEFKVNGSIDSLNPEVDNKVPEQDPIQRGR